MQVARALRLAGCNLKILATLLELSKASANDSAAFARAVEDVGTDVAGGMGRGNFRRYKPYFNTHSGGSGSRRPFTCTPSSFAQRYPHMGPNLLRKVSGVL
jgi:hypothetical protein